MNRLAARGATIVIDSARGSLTGEDWQARTEAQLRAWGLDAARVRTGVKVAGAVYVDDKACRPETFFQEEH